MSSFSQLPYFAPRTAKGLVPKALGGSAGKNVMNMYKARISAAAGQFGVRWATN
jgi:hypothetical protein